MNVKATVSAIADRIGYYILPNSRTATRLATKHDLIMQCRGRSCSLRHKSEWALYKGFVYCCECGHTFGNREGWGPDPAVNYRAASVSMRIAAEEAFKKAHLDDTADDPMERDA